MALMVSFLLTIAITTTLQGLIRRNLVRRLAGGMTVVEDLLAALDPEPLQTRRNDSVMSIPDVGAGCCDLLHGIRRRLVDDRVELVGLEPTPTQKL